MKLINSLLYHGLISIYLWNISLSYKQGKQRQLHMLMQGDSSARWIRESPAWFLKTLTLSCCIWAQTMLWMLQVTASVSWMQTDLSETLHATTAVLTAAFLWWYVQYLLQPQEKASDASRCWITSTNVDVKTINIYTLLKQVAQPETLLRTVFTSRKVVKLKLPTPFYNRFRISASPLLSDILRHFPT